MKLTRRKFLHLAVVSSTSPPVSGGWEVQAYPTRPITMIVPVAAGSSTDVVARVLAERLKDALGQPVIIENVGGGDGNIGVGRLARARPDGYTIDLGYQSAHVLNGAIYSLPYDVLNDFEPISPLAPVPLFLFARKTMPAESLNEFIAWLKANPDKTSAGNTSAAQRLAAMLFQKETGTHFAFVSYRGGGQAMQDLVAGQIDMFFYTPDQLRLARGAGVKAYAVTSDTRLAAAPDIPTFAEMGLPALSYFAWYGLFAPRGTPKDITAKLNAAAVAALADPAARSRLADLGLEIFPRERQTPEALGALVNADAKKWWPLIKQFGIKAE
jgi:tripartite-type tricarboxylate transporter receptor subunit TctC